jgi:hypothetical protein
MGPTCHVPLDICDGSGCGGQGVWGVLVQGNFVDRAVQVPPKVKLASVSSAVILVKAPCAKTANRTAIKECGSHISEQGGGGRP